MPTNKKRLEGMIGTPSPPQTVPSIQRGTPYQISTQAPPTEPELPAQAGGLSAPLQEIARRYIGARRRSGEALLEAARWLNEARTLAEHGEWRIFLESTGTSDDTAERLLNIHSQAMQNPQFAEAITRNWLSQSAAALLARPSTPPEVIEEVLTADKPPTKAEVEQKIRTTRTPRPAPVVEQNPHSAEFGTDMQGRLESPFPAPGAQTVHFGITPEERAVITRLTAKVAAAVDNPSLLSANDWATLEPLARSLSDLLHRIG